MLLRFIVEERKTIVDKRSNGCTDRVTMSLLELLITASNSEAAQIQINPNTQARSYCCQAKSQKAINQQPYAHGVPYGVFHQTHI